MKYETKFHDCGEGSNEDRNGLRWEVVMTATCEVTGFNGRHVVGRTSTQEAARALAKWAHENVEPSLKPTMIGAKS